MLLYRSPCNGGTSKRIQTSTSSTPQASPISGGCYVIMVIIVYIMSLLSARMTFGANEVQKTVVNRNLHSWRAEEVVHAS